MMLGRIAPFDTDTEDEIASKHVEFDGHRLRNVKRVKRKSSSGTKPSKNRKSRTSKLINPLPLDSKDQMLKDSTDILPQESYKITMPNMLDQITEESNAIDVSKKSKMRPKRDAIISDYIRSLLDINSVPKKRSSDFKTTLEHEDFETSLRLSPIGSNQELRNRGKTVTLQIESIDTQTEDAFIVREKSHPNGFLQLIRFVLAMILLIAFTYLAFSAGLSLISFHVLFMAICWLYLMTFGLNALHQDNVFIHSISKKNRRDQHWIMMLNSFIALTIGVIIIFIFKTIKGTKHISSLHDVFGYIAFVFIIANLIAGLINYRLFKSRNHTFSLVHGLTGILAYVIGIVTIVLKFFDEWWDGGFLALSVIISLVLINMLLTMYEPLKSLIYTLNNLCRNTKRNLN